MSRKEKGCANFPHEKKGKREKKQILLTKMVEKGGFPLGSRKLEEKIEALRQEMEENAIHLGISHPHVHRLSRQLDQLHNQWQKKRQERYIGYDDRQYATYAAG